MGTGATGSASNDRFYRQYTYNPFTYHGVKWVNIPGAGNTNQTVTIRAKGTQSSSVWPTMQLWVNGSLKASWQVNDTAWQSYSTSVAFTGREQIDVVFTNDGGTRDLFVENIKVGTVTLAANTAIYDRGAGNDTFNGDDVIAGQQGLYWNGALRFVYGSTATAMGYDLNGNMTYKLKQGEATVYTWNAENRLSAVTRNSSVLENYVYDVDGNRIKKSVTSGPVTRTFFLGHYEEEVTGSITTTIKHYGFNGQIIATRRGTTLSYLHTDHLSSNNLATSSSGTQTASYTYYAYGTTRSSSGTLPTDRTFTGQKQDSTGLIYLNARYYDPTLGQFLSPDTLVPDAGVLFDYNRYLYTRGNPLKYTDPTGHCGTLAQDGSIVEDDAECWQYALDIYLGWDGDAAYWEELFRMDRQQFWAIIAMDPHQRAPQLKAHVDKYWSAFYQRTGARHARYNPAPTWDEPPPHPIEGIADAITPDCENTDCTGRFLNGVSTASSVVAAGCTAFVVTGPCAPVATSIGVIAGVAATWRAGVKAVQPEATSVDVIDAVMSGATTVAGGLSHPYIGPLISAGQWTYDEYISPAMR